MDGWDQLAAGGDPCAIAARIIEECTTSDLAALRNDPFGTLVRSTEIAVNIEDDLGNTGCGQGDSGLVRMGHVACVLLSDGYSKGQVAAPAAAAHPTESPCSGPGEFNEVPGPCQDPYSNERRAGAARAATASGASACHRARLPEVVGRGDGSG